MTSWTRIALAALCVACGGRGGATDEGESHDDNEATTSVSAACAEYVEAAFTCYEHAYAGEDAFLDQQWDSLEDYCAAYETYSGDAWVEYFQCLEAAYDEASCGSPEDVQALGADLTACAPPQ